MAIFNCYVSSPEGKQHKFPMVTCMEDHGVDFFQSAEPLDPLLATQKAVIQGIEPGQEITSVFSGFPEVPYHWQPVTRTIWGWSNITHSYLHEWGWGWWLKSHKTSGFCGIFWVVKIPEKAIMFYRCMPQPLRLKSHDWNPMIEIP